jgi:hypothetical protein
MANQDETPQEIYTAAKDATAGEAARVSRRGLLRGTALGGTALTLSGVPGLSSAAAAVLRGTGDDRPRHRGADREPARQLRGGPMVDDPVAIRIVRSGRHGRGASRHSSGRRRSALHTA